VASALNPLALERSPWEQALSEAFPEKAPPAPHDERDMERYRSDPVAWAVEQLEVPEHTIRWSLNPGYSSHRWDGTADPMVAILNALAEWEDVAVESATGTGKTFLGAVIVLWFLDCFEGSTVVTAAPKEKQLTLHIWKEIATLFPKFRRIRPFAELTSLRIRMRPGSDDWAAHGFAAGVGASEESATKAQGFHAEHMLIITEETPGMHGAIMTAFENTSTAPHNLQLNFGNPDSQQDELHKRAHAPGVKAVRISALDHPNVVSGDDRIVPGAASRKSNERRRRRYGENSRIYQSRVRGISPAESSDALIKIAWIRAAQARYEDQKLRDGRPALGIDVANSENGDEAAIARGVGACLLEVTAKPCPDANQLARDVAAEMKASFIQPDDVGVDSVGVGAGTVNEFRRLNLAVQALSGGSSPTVSPDENFEEEFPNLVSQMKWQMRLDLEHGKIALPPDDDELVADLVTATWETKNGKIHVESKETIKKRLGRSPNKGDAAVYWNWVRRRPSKVKTGAKPRAMQRSSAASAIASLD
jgi:phage terminase large subunit